MMNSVSPNFIIAFSYISEPSSVVEKLASKKGTYSWDNPASRHSPTSENHVSHSADRSDGAGRPQGSQLCAEEEGGGDDVSGDSSGSRARKHQMETRSKIATLGSKNDIGRAAAFLMGIHPDRLCNSAVSSSSTSEVVDGREFSYPRLAGLQQNLTETPLTSLKSQTDDEPNAPTSLLSVDDTVDISPPPYPKLHPRPQQVSFLSNVGEMVKRVCQQGRHVEQRPVTSPLPKCRSHDSCSDASEVRAPLTVKNLVRAEGQGVRMRLVPIRSDANSHPDIKRYGVPKNICTILSYFEPPRASYWQDDRLVEPYLGECCGQAVQRRRGGRGEDSAGANGSGDEEWTRAHDTKVGGVVGILHSDESEVGYETHEESITQDRPDGDGSEGGDMSDGAFRPFGSFGRYLSSKRREGTGGEIRSYGKLISQHRCQQENVFYDAHFLDKGNITGGERRKKLIILPSYRASVISFVERKVLKKDINNDFYVQHPELEIREIKLTHMRAIRADLLNFALKEGSPIEVVTVAYANWYFERLIMRGMVGKRNRRLMLAVCVLLAIKFVETGDIHKKINYAKAHFRQDEAFEGVTWQKVQENEFRVYVGLDFTLMPEKGNTAVEIHLERLIGQINMTLQEYYGKNFSIR